MFQNKDGDLPESNTVTPEERAYEDNWYRSLKALADQRQDEDAGSEEIETPIGHPVLVATEEPIERVGETERVAQTQRVGETERVAEVEPVGETERVAQTQRVGETERVAEVEPVGEAEPVAQTEPGRGAPADAPATATDRERFVSQEFETRAGQLLERLRSIQHLGER